MRAECSRAGILALVLVGACRAAEPTLLDGMWRLDPRRSHYGVNAEPRVAETFICATQGRMLRCEIASVRLNGDTTRAHFTARPNGGDGTAVGIAGVDRIRLDRRRGGFDAVFLNGDEPVLGYRLRVDADSLVIETTDPRTREILDSRILYVRAD